jgi:hypothetical protein
MFRGVTVRRFAVLLLVLLLPAEAAGAMLLSCFPNRAPRTPGIDVYVDGVVNAVYPPKTIESIRVLTRLGEDVYEFFPEQVKEVTLKGDELRIHLLQPLSAGETAEMRFEGKIAERKGEPFVLQMFIRNERRSGTAEVRCTIE